MKERIAIYDTTLRDGEQAPGFSMNREEKRIMAKQLMTLGVDVIEAGFPAASLDDFNAVREIASIAENTSISALARAFDDDIILAGRAVKEAIDPRLHLIIPASDILIEYQMKKTRDYIITTAVNAVYHARQYCKTIQFSLVDATRADRIFLKELIGEVIRAGATIINISDTTGYALPSEIDDLIKGIGQNMPARKEIILSIHCHNDLGLATANTLAAIMAGVDQIEVTVNGIGERAGNTPLEEIVAILQTGNDRSRIKTAIDPEKIIETSNLLSSITGIEVHPHKPIVGKNMRTNISR